MCWYTLSELLALHTEGDVAQMVERSLSMWEVGGSIPPVSKIFFGPLSFEKGRIGQNRTYNQEWLAQSKILFSQSAGFEPALPEGNWFLVSRLNHSATTAAQDNFDFVAM